MFRARVRLCTAAALAPQPGLVYSGGDDAAWKAWDLRTPCHLAALADRRSHGAGVCCVASHPALEHVVATGSYDEHARVWDCRQLSRPVCACQVRRGYPCRKFPRSAAHTGFETHATYCTVISGPRTRVRLGAWRMSALRIPSTLRRKVGRIRAAPASGPVRKLLRICNRCDDRAIAESVTIPAFAQARPGAGVWRIKWAPHDPGLALVAAMQSGFWTLRVSGLHSAAANPETDSGAGDRGVGGMSSQTPAAPTSSEAASASATLECRYHAQRVLAYGADWWRGGGTAAGSGACTPHLVATASFYDKSLHLWEPGSEVQRGAGVQRA